MTFGGYLRELREEKGLRQADLAEKIGVSPVYVCDIEKGRRYPPDLEKLRTWVVQMALPPDKVAHFYDLAGSARNCLAPDVSEYLKLNPAAKDAIRRIMEQQKEYNWDMIAIKK